jgi:hypothetical protein
MKDLVLVDGQDGQELTIHQAVPGEPYYTVILSQDDCNHQVGLDFDDTLRLASYPLKAARRAL